MTSPNASSKPWPIGATAARLGLPEFQVAHLLGIPKQTLSRWRSDGIPRRALRLVERALRDLEREYAADAARLDTAYRLRCDLYVRRAGGGLAMVDPWLVVSIAPCPHCGVSALLWAEAGYVPGHRVCRYCGRTWVAQFRPVPGAVPEATEVWFEPSDPDGERMDYDDYANLVTRCGGEPVERRTWESMK